MKIVIEIATSRTTRFLGARVQNVKNGVGRVKNGVQSGFSRVRSAGKALVTKPASTDQAEVVS